MTAIDTLVKALRDMPDDAGMIENNPDEGMRLFCCDGRVVCSVTSSDRVHHTSDCWYVAVRAALADVDVARVAACTNALEGVPTEALEGIRLSGPQREVWCSTDSCREHFGWEPVDQVPDWAMPKDGDGARTIYTVV